jgi:hypothetical protein
MPMTPSRISLLILLSTTAHSSLGAQDSLHVSALRPGIRVRFSAPAVAPERFLGTVRWLTADSIALDRPDHRLATIPRSPITKLEVSLGASRMRAARRGLLWGVPIGAALGVFFCSTADPSHVPPGTPSNTTVIVNWMILSGVLGGGFGAANPSERWMPIPVQTPAPTLPQ